VNVETKQQSQQWMHTHAPDKPKSLNKRLLARKLMATVSRDRKRVLMVEFMQQGTTVTPEVHYETLRRAMQNNRLGMLTSDVVLLHGNARLHAAAHIRALMEYFNWELFDHPFYSSHLDPSDY
jgi:hypothetical protein